MDYDKRTIAIGLAVVLTIAAVSLSLFAQKGGGEAKPLLVYVADSYSAEASALVQQYHEATGAAVVPPVAGGSFALAREIEGGAQVTVFMPVASSAMKEEYMGAQAPSFAIAIGSDQLVLAHASNASLGSAGMNILSSLAAAQKNGSLVSWRNAFILLTSGAVKLGISDPRTDPAGLRGWLALEGAGLLFAGNSSEFTSSVMKRGANVTAASAAELVPPLEAGQIQFLFMYRSAALSQGLGYVQLPDRLNFGSPSLAPFYSSLTYNVGGSAMRGTPIVLYVTVPKSTNDVKLALDFVSFAVRNSATVLSQYGMVPLVPALLYNSTSVPAQISYLMGGGYLVEAGSL